MYHILLSSQVQCIRLDFTSEFIRGGVQNVHIFQTQVKHFTLSSQVKCPRLDFRLDWTSECTTLYFRLKYSASDWTSHPNLFGVEFRMYISFKLKSNILHCRLKSSVSDWSSGLTGLQNAPHYISVSSPLSQASARSCEPES